MTCDVCVMYSFVIVVMLLSLKQIYLCMTRLCKQQVYQVHVMGHVPYVG
jgi:hypothetical protein